MVQIPTNKPVVRKDYEDLVYKTEREKFTAVIKEILEFHERGQPVLVGTTSVEKSTAIARILKKRQVPHAVLNAKHHEKEAFVVAQAGRKGAITVSTNMAGRGTDIILGGNPEMLAKLDFKEKGRDEIAEPEEFQKVVEKYADACKKEGDEVREAGGLHILGTERHESRRIDNQLRGRAGRQGDPGSSRFYLSLEDDLMRIFAGDRVKGLMERMGLPDDEPIEHPWVTKSIGDAQSKVEARNFDIRKNLLEYDDVMNEQRKTVYTIRQQLLLGIYTPEIIDDDGKPTGRCATSSSFRASRRRSSTRSSTCSSTTGRRSRSRRRRQPRRRRSARRSRGRQRAPRPRVAPQRHLPVLRLPHRLQGGRRKPKKVYERLMKEIPQRLTEQRERMLDLIDGIVGRDGRGELPARQAAGRLGLEGPAHRLRRSLRREAGELRPRPDPGGSRPRALHAGREAMLAKKEEELGTELFLRVFRHFYLEDIDK